MVLFLMKTLTNRAETDAGILERKRKMMVRPSQMEGLTGRSLPVETAMARGLFAGFATGDSDSFSLFS